MYKLTKADNQVEEVGKNKIIPFDPANADYQAYLKWLAEGNEPLPADSESGQPKADEPSEG